MPFAVKEVVVGEPTKRGFMLTVRGGNSITLQSIRGANVGASFNPYAVAVRVTPSTVFSAAVNDDDNNLRRVCLHNLPGSTSLRFTTDKYSAALIEVAMSQMLSS
jgi:hypothetical protein